MENINTSEKKIDTQTFEEALKKLEESVLSLEKGDIGLDESIKIYEDGIKYSDYLLQRLDSAEKRIEELSAKNAEKDKKPFGIENLNI
ncbi:MAG: exodeoxyribonuclease VII small subunit [Candidatus Acidulodesulfobacterium sp.]